MWGQIRLQRAGWIRSMRLCLFLSPLLWLMPVTPVQSAQEGTLHLLAIGISEYQDSRIPGLRYADDDARALVSWASRQQGDLYRQVNTRVLVGPQATRANIIDALLQLYRSGGPDDLIMVFIGGHGLQEEQTGHYHFLSYDTQASNIAGTALKQTDLLENLGLAQQDSRRVLILADTCQAGAMSELVTSLGTQKRGIFVARGGQRIDDAQVMGKARLWQLISAGSATDKAVEGPEFRLPGESPDIEGHGLFSYSVLEALSTSAADINLDSEVSLTEFQAHVLKTVRERSAGRQLPEISGRQGEITIAYAPVQAELCDGKDNNRDGKIDENFPDSNANGIADCIETELCNGKDDNGNGIIDEPGIFDLDGDGHRSMQLCGASFGDDCNDRDPAIHGGQPDFGNLRDDDCDTLIDEDDFDRNCNGIPDRMELTFRKTRGAARVGLAAGVGSLLVGAVSYGLLYSVAPQNGIPEETSAVDLDAIAAYRRFSVGAMTFGGMGVAALGVGGYFSFQERLFTLQYPPVIRPYPPKPGCKE